MANLIDVDVEEEGPRNAFVKVVGILDTSDVTLSSIIALNMFLNNDTRMTLTGLRVDQVDYSSGPDLVTIVEWASTTPQLIASFIQSGKLDMRPWGGDVPNQQAAGYDGSINVRTRGYVPGKVETFTIGLKLVKLYRV